MFDLENVGFVFDDYTCAILMRARQKLEGIFDDAIDCEKEHAEEFWPPLDCSAEVESYARCKAFCDDPDFFEKVKNKEFPEDFLANIHAGDIGDWETLREDLDFCFDADSGYVKTYDPLNSGEILLDCPFTEVCPEGFSGRGFIYALFRHLEFSCYESIDAMVDEIKDQLSRYLEYFPDDYDWAGRICVITNDNEKRLNGILGKAEEDL